MKVPIRLLDLLGLPEALVGDVLEQTARRSDLWLWTQVMGAVLLTACRCPRPSAIAVRERLVGWLTAWRFGSRLWPFALAGTASFWLVARQLVGRSTTPNASAVLLAIAVCFGATLYRIGNASIVRPD